MATINKGNALNTPVLQPGYVVSDDGYEVLTCKATYKSNHGVAAGSFERGDSFGPDPRLKAHKITISYGANDIATITVDYIGLANTESAYSLPNVSGAATLTTEPIQNHPKFFVATGSGGIAGPNPYSVSTLVKALKPYTDRGPVWQGGNGSIFEEKTGGKFLGFYDPTTTGAKKLYQRTSYLAPTSTVNGTIYTSTAANVNTLLSYVGKTMYQRGPDCFGFLLPSYFTPPFKAPDEDPQWLIASAHFEDYGTIYKLTYELRFNREGYSYLVYTSTNV
jgi:hypothetical protein